MWIIFKKNKDNPYNIFFSSTKPWICFSSSKKIKNHSVANVKASPKDKEEKYPKGSEIYSLQENKQYFRKYLP